MTIFTSESELVEVLDRADAIVAACIAGSVDVREFINQLGHLHGYYALDGHESDEEERALLKRHSARIDWIERIIEEIGGICAEDDAAKEAYIKAGRFGSAEALRRLRSLVENQKNRTGHAPRAACKLNST